MTQRITPVIFNTHTASSMLNQSFQENNIEMALSFQIFRKLSSFLQWMVVAQKGIDPWDQ